MSNLDQISQAIGQLQTGVEAANDKLDHLHQCLHQSETGAIPRIEKLEHGQVRAQGIAAGLGFLGGIPAGGIGKLLLAKLGLS